MDRLKNAWNYLNCKLGIENIEENTVNNLQLHDTENVPPHDTNTQLNDVIVPPPLHLTNALQAMRNTLAPQRNELNIFQDVAFSGRHEYILIVS